MNVRLNVGGVIGTFKYLAARTPNSKEKLFLPPRISMYCYPPSSLRGIKPVHTIIKFLTSFLFHFDSPKPQASSWLSTSGASTAQLPDWWGRIYNKDRKDVFSSPFSPVNSQ